MKGNVDTISLCMIVKNEEAFLGKCIESAKPFVDELVVVDTGSSDNTKNIAVDYGARVIDHPWQDSFSEARNYALRQVTSEWVLQLDADERLEKKDGHLITQYIKGDFYHAIFVAILNYLPQGRTKLYFPRIFRKSKCYYQGMVHNQLVYKGKPLHSEIRIYHHGYNLDAEKMAVKYERSRRLLEQQLDNDPEDLFAWYNLIRLYKNQQRFSLAATRGAEVAKRFSPDKNPNIYLMILSDTATALMRLEQYGEAIRFAKTAYNLNLNFFDVLYTLGCCYLALRSYQRSGFYFAKFIEKVTEDKIKPKIHLLDMGTIDYLDMAYAHLGECQLYLQRPDQARNSFQAALREFEYRVHNQPPNVQIASQILSKMADTCIHLGMYKKAAEYYQQCLTQVPTNPQWLNNLATCYAKFGQTDLARIGYTAALQINPHYHEAQKNLRNLNHATI